MLQRQNEYTFAEIGEVFLYNGTSKYVSNLRSELKSTNNDPLASLKLITTTVTNDNIVQNEEIFTEIVQNVNFKFPPQPFSIGQLFSDQKNVFIQFTADMALLGNLKPVFNLKNNNKPIFWNELCMIAADSETELTSLGTISSINKNNIMSLLIEILNLKNPNDEILSSSVDQYQIRRIDQFFDYRTASKKTVKSCFVEMKNFIQRLHVYSQYSQT